MKPIVIVIAILFVILMVAFGRNPVEEAREERAKALVGKDPLINAIEEHNKKAGGITGFGAMGEGAPSMPTYQNPQGSMPTQPYTGQPPNYPGYMMKDGQPRNYQQPQTPAAPSQDNYYPPAAPSQPASPLQQPLAPHSQDGVPGIWLPTFATLRTPVALGSGQRIKFFGTRVYALDANGIPHPLPDGKYPLFGGRVNLVVKDGEKIIN